MKLPRALRLPAALRGKTAGTALAQPYPSKPVRIVIPASPGGASDLIARMLAPPLAETLGQPFIVENRVTSGGIVATQQVAESPADGHTLLVTFDTFAINPLVFKNLKWDSVRDFTPVMQICRYPQVLLVNPGLGVKSLAEFVALAKQKGAQLNYGSPGPASSSRPRLRDVQGRRRDRDRAGALQGRRAGDPGPALGPAAGDAGAGRRLDHPAREDRQADRARRSARWNARSSIPSCR